MSSTPKLLCVSLNPAVDRRIVVPHLRVAAVNRANSAVGAAGGKAAHVAFAAHALGASVRWLAFLGGAEGETCRAEVQSAGIAVADVAIEGSTRMTLEIIDEEMQQVTEILEPGPRISDGERESFLARYRSELVAESTVVLSGSLPAGVPSPFYADLVHEARKARCLVLLDTSGEALFQAVGAAPDVIKPNRQEAGALLGRQIHSVIDAVTAAEELRQRGPKCVVVSLGEEGAIAVNEHGALHARPPLVKARFTVGSGDSFLAGWAFNAAQGNAFAECLRLAVASGTANCLAERPGRLDSDMVRDLAARVEIEEMRRPRI